MHFIDSHCHLDFSEFDETRTELITACKQVGIEHFIVPGVSLAQSTKLLSFAKSEPSITNVSDHLYFYLATRARVKTLANQPLHQKKR